MNHENWIQDVARQARQESLAPIDVTDRVTARIQARQSERWDPMALVAGAAAAAAVIVIAHAMQALSVLRDPFVSLLAPMNLVLQ